MKNYRLGLGVITALFFLFGFITCLNDILVPHLKSTFSLNYAQAMLIQSAFFSAYFFFSLPAGAIVRRFGYPKGIIIGHSIAALGALLFYPASNLHSYPLFLMALFILACGITLLQVAANPYATALGPKENASARLNFVQAFNSVGTTIAPVFGTWLILRSGGITSAFFQNTTDLPYLGITVLLALMAAVVWLLKLPEISDDSLQQNNNDHDLGHALKYPHLKRGIIGIFCYVGAEVGIGSFLISYMAHAWSMDPQQVGPFITLYWGGAMVGRFVGTILLRLFAPAQCLKGVSSVAAVLVLIAILSPQNISPYFLLTVGLCNAIMFPVIFSLSIKGLGRYTSQGSAFLCMAIVGGAIVPLLQGFIADFAPLRFAFCLPLVCYGYVLWLAIKHSQPTLSTVINQKMENVL